MAEYAPSRSRATLITVMFMGITFGGMVPAVVTAIAPNAGWPLLFIVGGVMPLAASLLNLLFMPELLKFLAAKDSSRAKLLPLARRMRPDIALSEGTEFVFPHRQRHRFRLSMLFEGRLRWTTPLIWVLFVTNLMVNFFLNSWMPTVLRGAGLSPTDAAVTASMYYVGGVLGGLLISRSLDRAGLGLIVLFLVLACPAVMCLGIPGLSPTMLKVAVLFVGVTVLGNQLSFNSVAGLNYPTEIRANGTGWALGFGRLGAIAGPILGGQLLADAPAAAAALPRADRPARHRRGRGLRPAPALPRSACRAERASAARRGAVRAAGRRKLKHRSRSPKLRSLLGREAVMPRESGASVSTDASVITGSPACAGDDGRFTGRHGSAFDQPNDAFYPGHNP